MIIGITISFICISLLVVLLVINSRKLLENSVMYTGQVEGKISEVKISENKQDEDLSYELSVYITYSVGEVSYTTSRYFFYPIDGRYKDPFVYEADTSRVKLDALRKELLGKIVDINYIKNKPWRSYVILNKSTPLIIRQVLFIVSLGAFVWVFTWLLVK